MLQLKKIPNQNLLTARPRQRIAWKSLPAAFRRAAIPERVIHGDSRNHQYADDRLVPADRHDGDRNRKPQRHQTRQKIRPSGLLLFNDSFTDAALWPTPQSADGVIIVADNSITLAVKTTPGSFVNL